MTDDASRPIVTKQRVTVVDIEIPFTSAMMLWITFALAAIPAAILLAVIFSGIAMVLAMLAAVGKTF